MTTEEVNLLAFNYAYGTFTNGPGISCWNFTKFCQNKFNIYTKLKTDIISSNIKNISTYNFKNSATVHWWSGMTDEFLNIVKKEKLNGKKIIVGPNLFDGTNPELEIKISKDIQPDLILVVNKQLKYKLKKYLNYKIEDFMTGPDYDLWMPTSFQERNNKILWKGNSKHESKDIEMALEIRKKIVDKIHLMGYPSTYRYMDHVDPAARYSVYLITSLSETKSEAVLEQLSAGVPVVSHPGVFMMGSHYKTGIVCNRDTEELAAAALNILNDRHLMEDLSLGARSFILENFKKENLNLYYQWLLNEC